MHEWVSIEYFTLKDICMDGQIDELNKYRIVSNLCVQRFLHANTLFTQKYSLECTPRKNVDRVFLSPKE